MGEALAPSPHTAKMVGDRSALLHEQKKTSLKLSSRFKSSCFARVNTETNPLTHQVGAYVQNHLAVNVTAAAQKPFGDSWIHLGSSWRVSSGQNYENKCFPDGDSTRGPRASEFSLSKHMVFSDCFSFL